MLLFLFPFFLLQKSFLILVIQEPAEDDVLSSGPHLCKYLHLEYNISVIYDESKAVAQSQSHDKVPPKHAAN